MQYRLSSGKNDCGLLLFFKVGVYNLPLNFGGWVVGWEMGCEGFGPNGFPYTGFRATKNGSKLGVSTTATTTTTTKALVFILPSIFPHIHS